jgi:hypothetical protein
MTKEVTINNKMYKLESSQSTHNNDYSWRYAVLRSGTATTTTMTMTTTSMKTPTMATTTPTLTTSMTAEMMIIN